MIIKIKKEKQKNRNYEILSNIVQLNIKNSKLKTRHVYLDSSDVKILNYVKIEGKRSRSIALESIWSVDRKNWPAGY